VDAAGRSKRKTVKSPGAKVETKRGVASGYFVEFPPKGCTVGGVSLIRQIGSEKPGHSRVKKRRTVPGFCRYIHVSSKAGY